MDKMSTPTLSADIPFGGLKIAHMKVMAVGDFLALAHAKGQDICGPVNTSKIPIQCMHALEADKQDS